MKKKYCLLLSLALLSSCNYSEQKDPLVAIQIQDRNGLTETVSSPDRLEVYEKTDFLSSQPYQKVLRIYRTDGKNRAKITSYHPNGTVWQYLEVEEMRAFGAYREWYPNGQQKIEAFVIGGTADISKGAQNDWLFDGANQVWDEQGNLIAKIPYQKGSLEGVSSFYYPDGGVQKEIPYSNRSIHGNLIAFFPNQEMQEKTAYAKGSKHGLSLGYFDNGEPSWIEEYTDGLLIKGAYYSPEGEFLSQVENGWGFKVSQDSKMIQFVEIQRGLPEGVVKRFSSHQEPLGEYKTKDGKKHGEEIEYFLPDSQRDERASPLKKLSVEWNLDAIHGSVKTWHSNGQLQSQKEYCRNQLSGPSCAWYRNGTLMFLEEYEENKLVKGFYYKIGQTDPVSTILNGNGTATLFDEEGIFLKKISYVKGKPADPQE